MISKITNSYTGIDHFEEERHILVGSYFFLDNVKVEHERQVCHIIQIFSEIGGLSGIVIGIVVYLTTEITFCYVVAKLVYKFFTDELG